METNKWLAVAITAFTILTLLFVALAVQAQERVELLPFGDFEAWNETHIKESKLIGGQTKTLYKIDEFWDCSNAHARAFGVEKVSVSVRPEKRGDGYCCRMETTLEQVTALGIDLKALATGSLFTGKMLDVVGMQQSSDPNSGIDMGVPFTKRPKALQLDYKAFIQPQGQVVYADAGTKVKEVSGRDAGQITLILQHRWEENGHIYAYRVGTAHEFIRTSTDGWQNAHRVEVCYEGQEQECHMPLCANRHKARNSQGKMVFIEEVDWRGDVLPTHIIIQIGAGSLKPFTGCPGNIVWCDNIKLVYNNPSLAYEK
ncbi:MAG: PCMD domain-containing protein [Paludibacteraceae bacterium]|jgi:hypothetical protein|nr:PCMD domain-containing protein [Paludibacteraceae bacterium]